MSTPYLFKSCIVLFLYFIINISVIEAVSISSLKKFCIRSSCHTVLGLGLLSNPLLSLAAKIDPPVVVQSNIQEDGGKQVIHIVNKISSY